MPRPRSLTEDRIADAALAVLDRDGTDGLKMRAVAAELGMGTMSLYRYVSGRERLEGLVVDRMLAAVDTGTGELERWTDRVLALAERVRWVVQAHPAAVPLLLGRRHSAPASLRWGEAVLEVLAEAGFGPRHRAFAFRAILGQVMGALQAEHFGPLIGEGTEALAALPRESHPYLAETAAAARGLTAEEEFRRCVGLLLEALDREAREDREGADGSRPGTRGR
ncbi:TetR/AcrR family transcriptional regulator C-terminal domain-containing protein [Nocardiopsis sp. RSe5-2]|uniref:TetR/AcrR family transcriptional regulator C-terminal domain-containing protein n=1 Tax=Nocardiopsis endophytica TaxID=3018445 RepID=A0ABT4TXV9_9ACTN|nr:TetR/AcrR family transcriptional regulator C-terminal domain-containing protein [Nocardiopsis endophytica]MDA2809531.1 TetR/AcrR family transcriptional regulator C-terminal domain-containing protein [Nocardiopsis endophytica]